MVRNGADLVVCTVGETPAIALVVWLCRRAHLYHHIVGWLPGLEVRA